MLETNSRGRVPNWTQSLITCGLIPDTDSSNKHSQSDSEIIYHKQSKGPSKRRRKRKGKKKNEKPDRASSESEVSDQPAAAKPKAPTKTVKLSTWRLGQLNIADIRRHTEKKWRGLSQIMEDKQLHGIALQELRMEDASSFTVNQDLYKGLTLLVEPCVQGDKGGNAGGLGFLVRTELLDQGLFSHINQIKSEGFYGTENLAYLDFKVGTSKVKWVNTYVRSKPGSNTTAYEWKKIKSMCDLQGDKIIMGDINASIIYSRPTELWRAQGLGSENNTVNLNLKKIGSNLKESYLQHILQTYQQRVLTSGHRPDALWVGRITNWTLLWSQTD